MVSPLLFAFVVSRNKGTHHQMTLPSSFHAIFQTNYCQNNDGSIVAWDEFGGNLLKDLCLMQLIPQLIPPKSFPSFLCEYFGNQK
jgi:hypothetical protein